MRLVVVLASVAVACGARSELATGDADAAAPRIPVAGCKDALEPGALKPVERFCSDRSRRSPVPAPAHPHVVWTKTIPDDQQWWALTVDAQGRAIVAGRVWSSDAELVSTFDPDGNASWTLAPPPSHSGSLLNRTILRAGGTTALIDYGWIPKSGSNQFSSLDVVSIDGALLSTGIWLPSVGDTLVSPDGDVFVEDRTIDGIGSYFGGIARLRADGSMIWEDRGDCESAGDVPEPYAWALRGNDVVLACDGRDDGKVHLREVDENDVPMATTTVDGVLQSDVVVAPDGHALFLALRSSPPARVDLADLAPDGTATVHPLGLTASPDGLAQVAVAADGTFLSFDSEGLVAVADGVLRWRAPATVSRLSSEDLMADSASTVVMAMHDWVEAFDIATGAILWSVAIPEAATPHLAPAGAHAIYLLTETSLSLIAD